MTDTLNSLKVCLDIVSVFSFIQSRNGEVVLPVLYTRSCLAVNTTFPFFVINSAWFLETECSCFHLTASWWLFYSYIVHGRSWCLFIIALFDLAYEPPKPDKIAADPNSWIALECDATEKFSVTGAYKQDVPYAVYTNFNFMKTELESGWFAIKIEPDDKDDYGKKNLTKVC